MYMYCICFKILFNHFIFQLLVRPSGSNPQLLRSPSSVALDYTEVPFNEYLPLFVSHVESPEKFWCQHGGEQAQQVLTSLMERLHEAYSNLDDAELSMLNVIANRVCCAKFSEDGEWYRARVRICTTPLYFRIIS